MKRIFLLLLSLLLVFSFCACKGKKESIDATPSLPDTVDVDKELAAYDFTFSKRDGEYAYTEGAAKISLSDTGIVINGGGASAEGSVLTVRNAGTYVISGSLSDGMIVIKGTDADKIELVFDGVDIKSSSVALLIESGDKVFVNLAEGSENILSDGVDYTLTADESNVDAAVFSKSDLCIKGKGSLKVFGNYKNAVVSKDDLIIHGATLDVTSKNVGLNGKDCVKITDADIKILSGSDGIRSDNEEDSSGGYIYIQSGTFDIHSQNDCLQAHTAVKTDGGSFKLLTGEGSGSVELSNGDFGMHWDRDFTWNDSAEDAESQKGIKAGASLCIAGGSFDIDSVDDCIHSDGSMTVANGKIILASGDDAVHAEKTVNISGGEINVTKCYEGFEGEKIYISGGKSYINASDDGLNASSSAISRKGFDAGRKGGFGGGMGAETNCEIVISGGHTEICALGDGVDSNGDLTVTGGVLFVSGSANGGNGALDYQGTGKISAGMVIALGNRSMAMNFGESDGQCSALVSFNSVNVGTVVVLCDDEDKVLMSYRGENRFDCAVLSCDSLEIGGNYKLYAVTDAEDTVSLDGAVLLSEFELTSEIYGSGGGMGGFGGRGERPEGYDIPQKPSFEQGGL